MCPRKSRALAMKHKTRERPPKGRRRRQPTVPYLRCRTWHSRTADWPNVRQPHSQRRRPVGKAPVELRELPKPRPARNEALVAARAFSSNRGEFRSFVNNAEGWVPGQDVGGVVLQQAADGSGPAAMRWLGTAARSAQPNSSIDAAIRLPCTRPCNLRRARRPRYAAGEPCSSQAWIVTQLVRPRDRAIRVPRGPRLPARRAAAVSAIAHGFQAEH
jgi:hypothetical protein